MGIVLKIVNTNFEFETSEYEITGFTFKCRNYPSRYAKTSELNMLLSVEGDISRFIEFDLEIYELIKKYAKTEFSDETYYSYVEVSYYYRDDLVRKIIYPNAFINEYSETFDPHTGLGKFVIKFLQKPEHIFDVETEESQEKKKDFSLLFPKNRILMSTGRPQTVFQKPSRYFEEKGYITNKEREVQLRWIEADPDSINVKYTFNEGVFPNLDYYGINATFYEMSGSNAGSLYSFAINNGTPVLRGRSDGNDGSTSSSMNDYLLYLKNPISVHSGASQQMFLGRTSANETTKFPLQMGNQSIGIEQVRWAVGGLDLYMGESLNEKTFLAKKNYSDSGSTTVKNYYSFYDGKNFRTAVGYKKSTNKVILLTVFDKDLDDSHIGKKENGADYWEVRGIMENKFGCTYAMMLDGSYSSQISYVKDGVKKSAYAQENGSIRKVATILSVPSMSADSSGGKVVL